MDFRPKMLICGGSAYPREWDYKRLYEIAQKVGALLMSDMAHIRYTPPCTCRQHVTDHETMCTIALQAAVTGLVPYSPGLSVRAGAPRPAGDSFAELGMR